MNRIARHVSTALALIVIGTWEAAARPPVRWDWDKLTPDQAVPGELLVGFKPGVTAAAREALHAQVGATVVRTYKIIPWQHVKLPPQISMRQAAAMYEADPRVAYVEPNGIVHILDTIPDDPRYPELWGMPRIRAPLAWDRVTGDRQIVVAVIDTGIRRTHEDLALNMWKNPGEDYDPITGLPGNNGVDDDANGFVDDYYGWDFVNNDNDPTDDHGHGTHCAGTIGAVGNNAIGVVGVNWQVSLVAIKFLSASGSGTWAGAIASVDYAAGLSQHIRLTSNSWGGGGYSAGLEAAIQAAMAEGQLFVAAAGNSGMDTDVTPNYPSCFNVSNIISVAAIDTTGALASFSNYGLLTVDLAAPGVDILSTWATGNNAYNTISGTSMATPHVAGAAALLWSLNPNMSWLDVKDAILLGAAPNPNLTGRTVTGGELDLVGALANARAPIQLDRKAYRSDATVFITVDDSLVTPPTDQITVDWATTYGALPTVRAQGTLTLDRDAGSTRFTNSLTLTTGVTAVHGDLLTVQYVDPNSRTGTVSAPIDDVPPVMTNLLVYGVRNDEARVRWLTDEPSSSKVLLSTTLPVTGGQRQGPSGYATTWVLVGGVTQYVHEVTVTGLQSATAYYFAAESEDYAGNTNWLPSDLSSTNPADYGRILTRREVTAYENNMDGGPAGWTPYNFGKRCWEYGRPTYGPNGAYTGSNCWGTVLDGKYLPLTKAWLESDAIHVSENARLTFRTWYHFILTRDVFGNLVDADLAFIEVNDGTGWHDVTGLSNIPQEPEKIGFSGKSDGWMLAVVDLSGFSNRTIRLRFRVDCDTINWPDGKEAAGWYLDDVRVTHFQPVGLDLVGYTIDDDPALDPDNDGDGYPEDGESFVLNLHVFNDNPSRTYSNVTATIGSPDDGVTPSLTNVVHLSYGTLSPGASAFSGTNVLVRLQPGVQSATFLHGMQAANGGPWSHPLRLDIVDRYTVRGTVTNVVGGAPISGATVRGEAAGHPTLTATTALDGAYALNGCVPGVTYALRAGLPGLFSFSDPRAVLPPAVNVNFGLGKAYAGPNPTQIVFTVDQGGFTSTNLGLDNTAGTVPYQYAVSVSYAGSASNWLSVAPADGVVPAGSVTSLLVTASGSGLLPAAYEATLRLDGNDISGAPVDVPVTLNVLAAAVLRLDSVSVLGGDGDAYVEPGETLDLDLVLANQGYAPAVGIGGALSSVPTGVVAVIPSGVWPTILPLDSSSPSSYPKITVGALPDGTVLPFELTVTNATGTTWVFPFDLRVDIRHAIVGQVTRCSDSAPVPGAVVQAVGSNATVSAVTSGSGHYTLEGLRPGVYLVRVIPAAPYDSPPAQTVNASLGNVAGVDFCVAAWMMTPTPTNFNVTVPEGWETNRTLRLQNLGATAGHVWLEAQLVSGVTTGGVGQLMAPSVPPVDWDRLTDRDCAMGQLIVRFRDGTDAGACDAALAAAGVQQIQRFRLVPAVLVKTMAWQSMKGAAERLWANPSVLYVQPNYRYDLLRLPNDPYFADYLWGLRNVRQTGGTLGADIAAESAWDMTVGNRDIVVAVVDTGIAYDHPDLADNMWVNEPELYGVPGVDDDGNGYVDDIHGWDAAGTVDWTTWVGVPDNDPYPEPILWGTPEHGTHCAGTIGAVGNNAEGVVGVNWNVALMAVKIQDSFGRLLSSYIIGGMEYCISNQVRLSNHSYGGVVFGPLEYEAMSRAGANGQLMVCAAGNSGQNNDIFPSYPANFDLPQILSVAATDLNDVPAVFTCYGVRSVDIAAPGVDILSTIIDAWTGWLWYGTMSGTSMATPHVVGVAALLRSVAPWAPWYVVKQALLDGARRNPILDGWIAEGRQLDARGALERMKAFWLQFRPDQTNIAAGSFADIHVIFNAGGQLPAGSYEANIIAYQGLNHAVLPSRLTVQPAPVPVVAEVRVHDAGLGDGDGYAEPGETVDLSVRLLNDGSAILYSPTGWVSTATPGVVVVQSQMKWPSLSSDDRAWDTQRARVTFGGAVTGAVPFQLLVRSAGMRDRLLSFEVPVAVRRSIRGWVRDTGGAGVANARVECWGAGGGSAVTDAAGNYALHGLESALYRVRAVPLNHEKTAPVTRNLAAADATANFTVRRPQVTFSTNRVEASVQAGQMVDVILRISNAAADTLSYQIYEMPRRKVALISDGVQLTNLVPILTAMGFEVSNYTNNFELYTDYFGGILPVVYYSADDALVFDHDLVIADVSGRRGEGRQLLAEEVSVYEQYLARGGKLLFTGGNPLTRPDDASLAQLAGVTNLNRAAQIASLAEIVVPAPGSGLFVPIVVGDRMAVASRLYDLASADTNAAVVYARAGDASKLLRRVTPEGGVCYLWSGNDRGTEWASRGFWQDVLRNVLGAELLADVPWLQISPASGTLGLGGTAVTLRLDSDALGFGLHRAAILVRGNYPGAETRAVPIDFEVVVPTLVAQSTTGVRDWRGLPLAGNGDGNACLVQLIWAGLDGRIDPPGADGRATGDDVILRTYPGDAPFSRVGKGYEYVPGFGRFADEFRHDIRPETLSKKVYVRAWDAATFGQSVAYGDSSLYTLTLRARETHDFGSWVVNRSLGYPDLGGGAPDWNGDSIPDGYELLRGGDPRLPIEPLEQGGRLLSRFGTYSTATNGLYHPSKLFVAGSLIFVLDTKNNAVKVWRRSGGAETFVRAYGGVGAGSGRFSMPQGMGRHPTENRFAVADTGNHRVQVFGFDPVTGEITFERAFGGVGVLDGQFNSPRGVAITPVGRICVADTGNDRVQVFTDTGTFLFKFGQFGSGNGQFRAPLGIVSDAAGLIYVTDSQNHRVQVFSGAGVYLAQFGSYGTAPGQFNSPSDIQIGFGGRLYVADANNHRIQVFNSAYALLLAFGEVGADPGQLRFPMGVMPVPNSSDVYVADTFNSRIQRFRVTIDADGDGMEDGWEFRNGLDPDANDALNDTDGDGVLNIGEFRLESNPQTTDTDGDGLTDFEEIWGYGTNPTRRDTDGDGLSDGEEVLTYGTNPRAGDTDGDGWDDGVEVRRGSDPLNRNSRPPYTLNDYDGDGRSDVATYWPVSGQWFVLRSRTWSYGGPVSWGWNATIPVPGDYDGDGKSDWAVFLPDGGRWYVLRSRDGLVHGGAGGFAWGWSGVIPVPADYDGDGRTDAAVFSPADGRWWVLRSSNGQILGGASGIAWGWNGVIPVPADYDGDGKADVAVFWPLEARWYVLQSSNGQILGGPGGIAWGWNGVTPVPGDYDGDGKADLAVYWENDGWWYIRKSLDGSTLRGGRIEWGFNGAIPLLQVP